MASTNQTTSMWRSERDHHLELNFYRDGNKMMMVKLTSGADADKLREAWIGGAGQGQIASMMVEMGVKL